MTIEDLQKYKFIKSEIEAMEMELHSIYYPVRSPSTSSIGSHGNSVSNPTEQAANRAMNLEDRISNKIQELRNKAEEIMDWLDTVDDPKVRASIQWHYMIGCTWKETTRKVFGEYYESTNSRKLVYNWFGRQNDGRIDNGNS